MASMFAVLKSSGSNVNSKNAMSYIEKYSDIFEYDGIDYNLFKMPAFKKSWKDEFEESWQKATQLGVVDGTRKNEYITRNELVVILERLGLLK